MREKTQGSKIGLNKASNKLSSVDYCALEFIPIQMISGAVWPLIWVMWLKPFVLLIFLQVRRNGVQAQIERLLFPPACESQITCRLTASPHVQ